MNRIVDENLLDALTSDARKSSRGRQHLNLHFSYEDPCQRFLNAISKDSYIRPHRHSFDGKAETLIAIRGAFGILAFNDEGAIVQATSIGVEGGRKTSGVAVEISPETWHTVVSLTDDAVLLEVKAGPFDPSCSKEMANWAPSEESPFAADYLGTLRAQFK